jgi:hypothetical protein
MVVIFLMFAYEAQPLIPFFKHGPLIFWMFVAFGDQDSNWFLGVAERVFDALMFVVYWNKLLGLRPQFDGGQRDYTQARPRGQG